MKKIIFLITMTLIFCSTSFAGIFNEPDSIKDVIDNMQVSVGSYFSLDDKEWQVYTSASLFTFEYEDQEIVDINLGYVNPEVLLGSLTINIKGFQAWGFEIPVGPLEPKVGIAGGYDFKEKNGTYGIATLGFTWSF